MCDYSCGRSRVVIHRLLERTAIFTVLQHGAGQSVWFRRVPVRCGATHPQVGGVVVFFAAIVALIVYAAESES